MKILLFNDNPVVRKLVALSAQKTKDELSVIWSVDEIQESDYDLLIIDDALYSDELFESLKELVTYKSTLLMATRGKAVPAGFDNVINKPFLPTDLVDMFIKIDKKTASPSVAPQSVRDEESIIPAEPLYAINLDDTLPDIKEATDLDSFDLGDLDDEIDLGDSLDIHDDSDVLEDIDDIRPTAILDQEEVQEVQNLLDDTDSDDWGLEEEIIIRGIDEPDIHQDKDAVSDEEMFTLDDEEGTDELLMEDVPLGEVAPSETKAEEDFGILETEESLESFDDLDLELDDEMALANLDGEMLLDDDELGDLETQIQEAVDTLEADTLEKELDMGELNLDFDDVLSEELDMGEEEITTESNVEELDEKEIATVGDFGEFDELDMLDERELKLAIGEEVEDEPEIEFEDDTDDSLSEIEPLSEDFEEAIAFEEDEEPVQQPLAPSHAEGVEALQALLKALSNEEVAKSLKGLNISININFGNEQ